LQDYNNFNNNQPASHAIVLQIISLESQITNRRIREAVLGMDNGWLEDINDQIEALRAQL
jgi:hypothetical protein